MERVALGLDQVLGAQALVAVLAAAEVVEVVGVGVERLAEAAGGELEADPAPRAAALEHEQVAAVGVDVHQVRVQRADAQHAIRRDRRRGGRSGSGTQHHHHAADVLVGRLRSRAPARGESRPASPRARARSRSRVRARSRRARRAIDRLATSRVARLERARVGCRAAGDDPPLRARSRSRRGSTRTLVGLADVERAVDAGGLRRWSRASPSATSNGSSSVTIAHASSPPGRRWARAQRRNARAALLRRRAAGSSASARGTGRSRGARARTSARRRRRPRPRARRRRARAARRAASRVEVERGHAWPARASSSATRPVPGADVEDRVARRARRSELAPQRQVGAVGAALEVVPDDRARRARLAG